MTRISTSAQQQLILSLSLNTQKNINDGTTQLASGKKHQNYMGYGQDTSRLLSLKSELSRTEQFSTNIKFARNRVVLMEKNLSSIQAAGQDFKKLLDKSFSGDAKQLNEVLGLGAKARDMLGLIADALNARDDSRYLFSGSQVDQKPIDFTDPDYTSPNPPANGNTYNETENTSYYQGDGNIQAVRASENFTVSFGVTADNPAIEKIIRALDHIAQMSEDQPYQFTDTPPLDQGPNSSRDMISKVRDNLHEGLEDLKNVIAALSQNHTTMTTIEKKNQQFELFTENSIGEIENINKAEVLAKFNNELLQLQASFSSLAKVQQLTLLEFI